MKVLRPAQTKGEVCAVEFDLVATSTRRPRHRYSTQARRPLSSESIVMRAELRQQRAVTNVFAIDR